MKRRTFAVPLVIALSLAFFGLWAQGAVPDVPTGQWLPGPALAQPRAGAVSVALDDGRVLVIGGRTSQGPVDTVEVLNADGSMAVAAPMLAPRAGHAAAKLPDGRVLVVGGTTLVTSDTENGLVTSEAVTNSAEIFDSFANVWYPAASLAVGRSGHTATAVADGRVLVAGGTGQDGAALDSFEVFNSDTGDFGSAGLLSAARTEHAAAVAGPTKVLVAGGRNANGVLATADVIDLKSGTVSSVVLNSPRAGASATTLLDGRMLVAGGSNGAADLASAEVVDPVTGISMPTGSMGQTRSGHQALLLANNNTVLVTGGTSGGAVVSGAEQFIPWTGEFSATGSPASSRASAVVSNVSKESVAWLGAGRAADGAATVASEFFGFATLKTDKDDYPPGETVSITGSGWQPGERVTLVLHEVGTGHADRTYYADADSGGRIANTDFVTDLSHMGVRFFLTARGASSQAQMTFTDAVSLQGVSAAPSSVTVNQGNSAQYTVTVSFNGNGSTGCTATLGVSNLPSGATASWTPSNQVSATSGVNLTRTLNIATTTSTATGTFTLTIQATAPNVSGGQGCNGGTVSTTADVTVNATSVATTTTVASSANPSTFGQSVTFTATVTPASGSSKPTGSVQFKIDGVNFGSPVPLGPGSDNTSVATSGSTSALTVTGSPHTVTAEYIPTGSFNASTGTLAGGQVVNKANQTITFGALANKTYGDADFTVSATASSGLAVNFSASGNCTLSGSNTVHITGAGSCTITASQAGDANYNAAPSVQQTFTIAKAAAVIVVNGFTGVYDGLAHGATGSATGVFGEDLSSLISLGASFIDVPGGTANWTFAGNADYSASSGTAAIVITSASSTTTVTCPASVTYTGSALEPCTATVTGAGGLNQTLTVTYTDNVNAGTASASASFPGDGNHAASSDSKPFTIDKATSTTTLTCPGSVTYTGSALEPCTAIVTGAGGLNESLTVTHTDNVNVGTASASASFPGDGNHTTSSDSKTFTIDKAASTTTVTCPTNVTYTGSALEPCSATVTGAGGLNQSVSVTYTDNVNAGTASASATFAGDANHESSSDSKTFTIDKAASATTVTCPTNVTYTGSALEPCTATVMGAGGLNQSVSVTYTDNVNAGTASASATFAGDANHESSSDSKTFTIDKAPSTTTVTCPTNVTYTGSALEPCSATVTGAGGLNESLTVTYTNNVNAGTASASATFAGDANHESSSDSKTFTIDKAASTTTVTCPTNVTYTGSALEPCSATVTGAGGLNQPVNVTYTDNVNAGTATASASYAGDANHLASSDSKTFTIDKASSTTVVTCPASSTFDGSPQTPCTAAVTGAGGLNQALTVNYSDNTNAGTASASASYPGDANHEGSSDSQTFTINKASSTTVVTCPASVTFDGSPQTPCTAAVTGAGGLNQALTVNYSNNTDAGTASASASYPGDANHEGSSDSQTFLIAKAASITVVTCPVSVTFDGSPQTPCTATVTGAGGLDEALTVNHSDNTNAGTASASATFAGDDNHEGSSDSQTFTIDKASSATVISCPTNVTYTGAALTPCSATATGAGGLSVSVTVTYGNNLNAGTATADASFGGDLNHHGSTASQVTFTIDKASSTTTVMFEAGPYTYRGTAFTATAVVTGAGGLNSGLSVNYTGDCTNVTSANGCTAAASFGGDANHDPSNDTKSITVTRATANILVNGFTGTYDGHSHGATGSANGVGGANLSSLLNLGASFTNVPGGTANWTFNAGYGNNNYNTASGDAPVTITQAPVTVYVTAANAVFTGSPYAGPTTCTSDGVNGEHPATSLKYVGTGSTSYAQSSTPPTAVGTYNAVCSAGGAGTNYVAGSQSAGFSIGAWTLTGFYQPVTMGGVYNTVKGGSTVPLKFNIYQGAQGTNERTDVAAIKSFQYGQTSCGVGVPEDPVDVVTTGGTTLRYDTTAHQFIQNWQTPKQANNCYAVVMTTQDGSTLVAYVKTK